MAGAREAIPTTAVDIFQPPATLVEGPPVSLVNGKELQPADESLRGVSQTPEDMIRLDPSTLTTRIPGAVDTMLPDVHLQTFRPFMSAAVLRQQKNMPFSARATTSGRTEDIDITVTTRGTAGPEKQVIQGAILDTAFMPGDLGMRKQRDRARRAGVLSPYETLVDEPRDVIMIFRLDRERKNCFNKLGEWVLQSVLDGTSVLPEDVFFEVAAPKAGKRTEDDHYEFQNGFVAAKCYEGNTLVDAKEKDMALFNTLGRFLRQPNSKMSRSFLKTVTESYLEPNYNYQEDKKLKTAVKDMVTLARTFINAHEGSLAEPLRAYLRADYLMAELDEKQAALGLSDKAMSAARKRIISGLMLGLRYVNKIDGLALVDRRKAAESPDDFSLPTAGSARFEIVSFDHIDAAITRRIDEALKQKGTPDRDDEVLKELQAHLFSTERPRTGTFAVRGVGNVELKFLTDLSPDNDEGVVRPGVLHDGTGLPNAVMGSHYGHEVIQSLLEPIQNKDAFPLGGLAMAGVGVVFEARTAEKKADPRHMPPEWFLILTSEEAPNMFTEAVLDQGIFKPGQTPQDTARLLNGQTGLTEIYTRPRVQSWEFALQHGESHHMELASQTLYNGSTLAMAFDANKQVYPEVGRIPKQSPKLLKTPVPERTKTPTDRLPDPVYKSTKGSRTGHYAITDETGTKHYIDNRLLEVTFADGTKYIRRFRKSKSVSIVTSAHTIAGAKEVKRRWFGGRKK